MAKRDTKNHIIAPVVHRLGKAEKEFIKLQGKDGKMHKAKVKGYTEYDPDDRRLIKIAPMFFFSLDSHKVIMIPFSVKFTVEEYLKQVGSMAVNFQEIINEFDTEKTK